MTLHPEVQRKAQEELDRVVGTDRLPTFADRDNLPYLEALVSEVHRWMPVSPMGMCSDALALEGGLTNIIGAPHRLLQDDEHAGYFIPGGSIVLANIL